VYSTGVGDSCGGIRVLLEFPGIPRDSVRRAFRRYVLEGFLGAPCSGFGRRRRISGRFLGGFGRLPGILDVSKHLRADYREMGYSGGIRSERGFLGIARDSEVPCQARNPILA
jgi:hypothetical protein